jgi:hypothetical protein
MATAGYFAALGLGYLGLEMTILSRLTHVIGDPVVAAAVTISGFLLLSGLGSLTAQRIAPGRGHLLRGLIGGLVIIGVAELIVLRGSAGHIETWPLIWRGLLAAATLAPLAYLMGFPMPLGLQRLDRAAPALIPWAWGLNGFASVLAAPLATLIGMAWGFHLAGALALLLYLTAGLLFARLPRAESG